MVQTLADRLRAALPANPNDTGPVVIPHALAVSLIETLRFATPANSKD